VLRRVRLHTAGSVGGAAAQAAAAGGGADRGAGEAGGVSADVAAVRASREQAEAELLLDEVRTAGYQQRCIPRLSRLRPCS
jgi:hypothetical protein